MRQQIRQIYLDNAATTPMLPEVATAMEPFLNQLYGNPSSIHGVGREARRAVERARQQVANLVGCKPNQLVFTASGTDAVHHALVGAFLASVRAASQRDRQSHGPSSEHLQRRHIVTTAMEHHAGLHTCALLEELGADVTYVAPDQDCGIRPADILQAMRPDTLLVSVMAVNNEVGSVQPVSEIARQVKMQDPEVLFHSDMVQALPVQHLQLSDSEIDFASFSAHKIHGPKGVGALYLASNHNWVSVLRGGNQERQRRGGTENVPGIVGFGVAAASLAGQLDEHVEHLQALVEKCSRALEKIPGYYRNSPKDAAPTILNVGFAGIPQDALLMRMDLEGVAASAGSACAAGSLQPSHVLKACRFPEGVLKEAVRLSFSAMTSEEGVLAAISRIAEIVESLR